MEPPTIYTEGRVLPPRRPVTCPVCGAAYCECCESSCPNIHCECIALRDDLLAALELAVEHMYACSGECDGSHEVCPRHKVWDAIDKAKPGA